MPEDRRKIKKFKIGHVLDAIKGSAGIKVYICNKLKCCRVTFDRYLRECPEVAQAFREEVETFGDVVESKLIALIRDSGDDRASMAIHLQAIKFYCRTRLKERGYVERQEIHHENLPMMSEIDLSKMSPGALEEVLSSIRAGDGKDKAAE